MLTTALALLGLFVLAAIVCVPTAITLVDKAISTDEGLGVIVLGVPIGLIVAVVITALAGVFLL